MTVGKERRAQREVGKGDGKVSELVSDVFIGVEWEDWVGKEAGERRPSGVKEGRGMGEGENSVWP